jgi:sugar-specific transcriptional regulator TrmB
MDSAVLEHMGLTKIEAKVYLALLENGNQAAGAITKSSGVHRRTVYDAISRLIEKGLVSYIKAGNVKMYQAAHPERLMELLKDQEDHLSKELPMLEKLYESQPGRHETVFFRGKKGLKTLFDDQLKTENSTILVLGATTAAFDVLQFYFPQFDRTRKEKQIKVQMLFDQRVKGKSVKHMPLCQARMITLEHPQDVMTCIYGDTVSIVTFTERPFGIVIREQAVADQYRAYFDALWKKGITF